MLNVAPVSTKYLSFGHFSSWEYQAGVGMEMHGGGSGMFWCCSRQAERGSVAY
jgi:hypothetical protein